MLPRFRNTGHQPAYDLLLKAARNAAEGTDALLRLLEQWPDARDLADRLVALEHSGDEITHQVAELVHSGSFSGSDRADLVELATAIDDIIDFAEETAAMMGLYGIEAPMEQAVELAQVLNTVAGVVAEAVSTIPRMAELTPHIATIHRLENEGDRLNRAAVAALFVGGIDPMIVIRWKDVYDRLEAAIDACERVADLLTGLALKDA